MWRLSPEFLFKSQWKQACFELELWLLTQMCRVLVKRLAKCILRYVTSLACAIDTLLSLIVGHVLALKFICLHLFLLTFARHFASDSSFNNGAVLILLWLYWNIFADYYKHLIVELFERATYIYINEEYLTAFQLSYLPADKYPS